MKVYRWFGARITLSTLLHHSCVYHPCSCGCSERAAAQAVKAGSLGVIYCQLSCGGMQKNLNELGQWSAHTLPTRKTWTGIAQYHCYSEKKVEI